MSDMPHNTLFLQYAKRKLGVGEREREKENEKNICGINIDFQKARFILKTFLSKQ